MLRALAPAVPGSLDLERLLRNMHGWRRLSRAVPDGEALDHEVVLVAHKGGEEVAQEVVEGEGRGGVVAAVGAGGKGGGGEEALQPGDEGVGTDAAERVADEREKVASGGGALGGVLRDLVGGSGDPLRTRLSRRVCMV